MKVLSLLLRNTLPEATTDTLGGGLNESPELIAQEFAVCTSLIFFKGLNESPELIAQESLGMGLSGHSKVCLNESPELIAQESYHRVEGLALWLASMKVLSLLLRNQLAPVVSMLVAQASMKVLSLLLRNVDFLGKRLTQLCASMKVLSLLLRNDFQNCWA